MKLHEEEYVIRASSNQIGSLNESQFALIKYDRLYLGQCIQIEPLQVNFMEQIEKNKFVIYIFGNILTIS